MKVVQDGEKRARQVPANAFPSNTVLTGSINGVEGTFLIAYDRIVQLEDAENVWMKDAVIDSPVIREAVITIT